jgi:hypothetical protein
VGKGSKCHSSPTPFFALSDISPCKQAKCGVFWLAAWNNDQGQSQARRLKAIKKDASPERFDETESTADNVTRFIYRLRDENEDGPVKSISACILNDEASS